MTIQEIFSNEKYKKDFENEIDVIWEYILKLAKTYKVNKYVSHERIQISKLIHIEVMKIRLILECYSLTQGILITDLQRDIYLKYYQPIKDNQKAMFHIPFVNVIG